MPRTRKRMPKEVSLLRRLLVERALPRKSAHELELAFARQDTGDRKPLPAKLARAVKAHQRDLSRRKKTRKSGGRRRDSTEFPPNREYFEQQERRRSFFWSISANQSTDIQNLRVDPSYFTNPVSEGTTRTWEGSFTRELLYKTAYSEAGYLNNVTGWNRTVFGFVSSFRLPQPGRQYSVRILSHPYLMFTWPGGYIEAYSLGRKSWGEVDAYAHMDVLVGDQSHRAGVTHLLHAESPRGNWQEDELGIYMSVSEIRHTYHDLELTVRNPANSSRIVYVFELAEFIAQRHHRADRCAAALWGTGSWAPLDVQLIACD